MATSRVFSSFPLDDDVIDRILASLPDHETLFSMVRTCKAVYSVYKTHPKSITRSVCKNIVGPALPQALLAACRYHHDIFGASLPEEKDELETGPISAEVGKALATNATTAWALEDLFSWRHKDRTNKSSQLSCNESFRFQRALYRFWLFSDVFGVALNPYEMDDIELDTMHGAQSKFLKQFPTQELKELERVAAFLRETVQWVKKGFHADDFVDEIVGYALSVGPRAILETFRDQNFEAIFEASSTSGDAEEDNFSHSDIAEFFFKALTPILKTRDSKIPDTGLSYEGILLNDVAGRDDPCAHCGVPSGLRLWNETNWQFVGVDIFTSRTIMTLLKGKLARNASEADQIFSTLESNMFVATMAAMMELRTGPFADLTPQDWLCENCIREFLRAHLNAWWLDQRRKRGEVIQDDCWYGWSCRTQVHRLPHAMKLNHFCKPTRGDDVEDE
ncbi:hypothetical protein PLICRDRAFT_487724 [Plicaturopsis crispa FD-325 SS-3]|nr:hypothetical protein PLICRDRAFT_487724 [Plicaturopsis crispa FD-325 SS-3]